MALEDLAKVLGSESLCLVDCGASFFLPDTWNYLVPLPSTRFVLVDPVGQSLDYARQFPPERMTVVPTALSRQGGAAEFYLANTTSGSSLLPPQHSAGRSRLGNPEYFFPLKIRDIPTSTLAGVLDDLAIPEVHALKLDTQGSELDIVKGLDPRRLDGVLLVEMEVSLHDQPIYLNMATLPQVLEFFAAHGFRMMNFRAGGEMKAKLCKGPEYAATLDGQVEADVLFVRDIFRGLTSNPRALERLLRRQMALLCAYYLHAEAIDCARHAAERHGLPAGLASELEAAVRRFAAFQTERLKGGILSLWHRDKT